MDIYLFPLCRDKAYSIIFFSPVFFNRGLKLRSFYICLVKLMNVASGQICLVTDKAEPEMPARYASHRSPIILLTL